jgi:hypothetical protein
MARLYRDYDQAKLFYPSSIGTAISRREVDRSREMAIRCFLML